MVYLYIYIYGEQGRGQQSVVWLKRSQPTSLHHLHVLSTMFCWQPLSSFSLWIIIFGGSWLEGAGLPAMGA